MKILKTLSKKELKDHVNSKGGFFFSNVETEKNIPERIAKIVQEGGRYTKEQQNAILEHGTYFKGISSNGDLNRNGYIIRSKAWKPAIENYLKSNPAVLLQHNSEFIIGHTLTAKVSQDQLITEGIIFKDQMPETSALAFSRGQLKALSTGHYTKEIEWENQETGEVMTTEEFKKLSWEERMEDFWVMAVTALEWVEQSLVAIGSNRDSMITMKNAKLNYFENTLGENITDEMKNSLNDEDDEEIEEEIGDPTDEEIEEIEEEVIDEEIIEEENKMELREVTKEDLKNNPELAKEGLKVGDKIEFPVNEETEDEPAEKEVENEETEEVENPAEATTENVEEEVKQGDEEEVENTSTESVSALMKESAKTIKEKLSVEEKEEIVEKNEPQKLEIRMDHLLEDLDANGLGEVKELFKTLSAMIQEKDKKINLLLTSLEDVPKYKGLAITSQFAELIQKKNAPKNGHGTDGSAILKAFENSGLSGELR